MKKLLLIALLVILSTVATIVYVFIPLSDSAFIVDKAFLEETERDWQYAKKQPQTDSVYVLKISHQLRFHLNDYKIIIRDSRNSHKVLYYGDYKDQIAVRMKRDRSWLRFVLFNADNNAYIFGSKGGGTVFKKTAIENYQPNEIKIVLYPFVIEKFDGKYKTEIPVIFGDGTSYFYKENNLLYEEYKKKTAE